MTITNEHLDQIANAFSARVLYEIFGQYRKSGDAPSPIVCAALGQVYGKTAEEIEAAFKRYGTSALVSAAVFSAAAVAGKVS